MAFLQPSSAYDASQQASPWLVPGEGRVPNAGLGAATPPSSDFFGLYDLDDELARTTQSPNADSRSRSSPSSSSGSRANQTIDGIGSSLSHTLQTSSVQKVFFSKENIDALQEGIRYGVFKATNGEHVIGRQSDVELGLIMRSVYLQDSCNLEDCSENATCSVINQVRSLNKTVLDFCIPQVTQELRMYVQYRQDIASLPVVMDRAQLATSKGDRALQFRSGI